MDRKENMKRNDERSKMAQMHVTNVQKSNDRIVMTINGVRMVAIRDLSSFPSKPQK
jgi:hypothetical protein